MHSFQLSPMPTCSVKSRVGGNFNWLKIKLISNSYNNPTLLNGLNALLT